MTMTIEFDRRHAFYFDAEGTPHIFCPYRLDRLWRGEPEATEPQLANQRIRFAIFHIERFSSPPRVVIEYERRTRAARRRAAAKGEGASEAME